MTSSDAPPDPHDSDDLHDPYDPSMRFTAPILHSIILLTGIALAWSGIAKLLAVDDFALAITDHQVIPASMAMATAWIMSIVEVVIGVGAIVLHRLGWSRAAGVIPGVMLALFGAYAFVLVIDPPLRPAPCGCFGTFEGEDADWTLILVRNLVWSVLVMLSGLVLGRRGLADATPTA